MFDNIQATELKNDVLRVIGIHKKTGEVITAYGWISATTNHYSPGDYQDDGHLKEGAKSHIMTEKELYAYYLNLLEQAFDQQEADNG